MFEAQYNLNIMSFSVGYDFFFFRIFKILLKIVYKGFIKGFY